MDSGYLHKPQEDIRYSKDTATKQASKRSFLKIVFIIESQDLVNSEFVKRSNQLAVINNLQQADIL